MKKIRTSIDDHPFIIGKGIKVFVNGKGQRRVVIADEGKGYVLKHAVNEQGHAYVDKKYGEVAMDTVVGKVKIKLPFSLWWMRLPKWMGGCSMQHISLFSGIKFAFVNLTHYN